MFAWRSGRTVALAAAAVVLCAAATGVLRRPLPPAPLARPLLTLVEASKERRFTTARLAPPFEWGALEDGRGPEGPALASRAAELAVLQLHQAAIADRTPDTLRGDGLAYLARGDVDRAVASFDAALQLDPAQAPTRADLSAALYQRWQLRHAAIDGARALEHAVRALDLQPELEAALYNRALALEAVGFSREAGRAWQLYLSADTGSAWSPEARAHVSRLTRSSAPDPAVETILKLDQPGLAAVARDRPLVLYRLLERRLLPEWGAAVLAGQPATPAIAGRVAAALEQAGRDRSLVDLTRLAMALPPRAGTARTALAKAFVALSHWWEAYDASAYDEAERVAERARGLLARAGASPVEADIRASIVDVARGRTEAGVARLDAIEAAAAPRQYTRTLAMAAQLRGLAAMQRISIDEAVAAYTTGAGFAARAGDTELEALTAAYLGTAHWTQGNHADAWTDFAAAAGQHAAVASVRRGFQVFSRAAELAQRSGWPGAALAIGEALAHDPLERPLAWTQCAASLFKARAWTAMGKPVQAEGELAAARTAALVVPDPAWRAEMLAEVAITTGTMVASSDPARAVADLTEGIAFQRQRSNQFRTGSLLLTRGRAFARAGDTARAERDWLDGVHLFEDTRLSVRDAQLRIARSAESWQLFDELVQVRRNRPRLALETVERAHARELLDSIARSTSLAPFRAGGGYRWLPANATALVYAVGAERLLIWTVTARRVTLTEQPVRAADLSELVERSVRAIREGRDPDPRLGALLLPSGFTFDRVENLIVVPDGPLYQVPFGMLRDARGGRRVLEATVVTIAPSLAVLKALQGRPRRSRPASTLLVGVGLANPEEKLPALPGVGVELAALQRLYPGARVVSGPDATPEAVLDRLQSTDLLHFAGHAVSDELQPARSRLVLAPGRRGATIRPADLATAHLRSGAVVVLGACETAGGAAFRGEGPLNLARPFLVGGAASVVATLWPVADAQASRMLIELHRLISSGVAPGRALTLAQRQAEGVSSDVRAAFVLIGRM